MKVQLPVMNHNRSFPTIQPAGYSGDLPGIGTEARFAEAC